MSEWLNNKKIIWKKIIKPCRICRFCPYGQLVEEFPFTDNKKISCEVFGHDCPAFYHVEPLNEGKDPTDKDFKKMYEEFKKWYGK